MSKDGKKNAQFIEKRTPKIHGALIDLADDINGVPLRCRPYNSTLSLMSATIAHPELLSMTFNLLLGNLPACYVSMRAILEAIVDSTIASSRFSDYPYPQDLEQVRKLERNKNLKFKDKCDLFLHAWIKSETRNNVKKLYDYLSQYWVHPKGIARKLREITDNRAKRFGNRYLGPSWILIIPYSYRRRDIDDLREFSQKITILRDSVRALLRPFIKSDVEIIDVSNGRRVDPEEYSKMLHHSRPENSSSKNKKK